MPCLLNWQCFHNALQAMDDASMAGFLMYGPGQQADVWARAACAWLVWLEASCFGHGPGRAACLVEQLFHDWIGHMEGARQLLAAKKINNA